MVFASNLYVDKDSKDTLLKKHPFPVNNETVYLLPFKVIYIPEGSTKPEFADIEFLKFPYYDRHVPLVIGFASSEENAVCIMKDIIEQTAEADEELNYRRFIESGAEIVEDLSGIKGFYVISPEAILNEE